MKKKCTPSVGLFSAVNNTWTALRSLSTDSCCCLIQLWWKIWFFFFLYQDLFSWIQYPIKIRRNSTDHSWRLEPRAFPFKKLSLLNSLTLNKKTLQIQVLTRWPNPNQLPSLILDTSWALILYAPPCQPCKSTCAKNHNFKHKKVLIKLSSN